LGEPRIAVTGAGGYLGGRLVGALHAAGIEVAALVRRPAPWLPVRASALDLAAVEVADLAAELEGCSAVVHLAGPNEVDTMRDVDRAVGSTLAAARRVAAASVDAGVGRLVVLSTTHVYGAAEQPGTVLGPGSVAKPRHPYAIARLAAEHIAATDGPAELVVLRLTNAVGALPDPRVERWTLVANDLCRQAVEGPVITLRTSGHQWRDFIALADAVEIISAAALGAVPSGTYDLGSGVPTRVLDLATMVAEEASVILDRPTSVSAPAHDGPSPEPSAVDVRPLAGLGLRAHTDLRDAVRETLRACVAQPSRG
jgi:UDP-glucose 4-epimerase